MSKRVVANNRRTVSKRIGSSSISRIDSIRHSILWGGGALLFVMVLLLVWLNVQPVMYTMRRGDIHSEQTRLNAEIRKLQRDIVRLTKQETLEARARIMGFHPPERGEMIKVKASDEILKIKAQGMTANK